MRIPLPQIGRAVRRVKPAPGRRVLRPGLLALAIFIGLGPAWGQPSGSLFEQANRLYEEGRYREAAATYEQSIRTEQATVAHYFNLGNAWFKAGQNGRAIAAYRQAQPFDPRNPNLRFNLQFVRQQVTGQEAPPGSWWRRWLLSLTPNEWAVLFMLGFWTWLLLLSLREWRPAWRPALSGYTAAAGAAACLLGLSLFLAHRLLHQNTPAVVIVPEAVVRLGPLEESKVHFQLRDGEEITVLDRKSAGQDWLQIRDSRGRSGWLKAQEVILLPSAPARPGPTAATNLLHRTNPT